MSFHFGNFATPWWFLLFAGVGALLAGYLLVQRVVRTRTLRFASAPLLDRLVSSRPGWRAHIPVALLLVAFALLTIGLAGPTAEQKIPRNRATVLLVIDVSLSMKSTDIPPSRLEVAKTAAKTFADEVTPGVNIGLISFADSPTVLVSPTTDRTSVKQGLDSMKTGTSTATGDAIATAISTIDSFGRIIGGAEGPPPARIVLMSDGKENYGTRKSTDAADDAKKAGIPISTISYGTDQGVVDDGSSTSRQVPVDDKALKDIADRSGGSFFKAASADQLRGVYDSLREQIGFEVKVSDASRPWLTVGSLLALLAIGSALVLGQRLP
ncbi:VWA domain-containing protein [Solihabitans fulvus]|uniref:VWA domain-containing protein n=1 Tax=Solihabitans fulvus TaxID=1892852 RepID=A0A5B2WPY6_9PSEU|nr:VWA domain-containing protein [Solihabitans fulvus]KAA2253004.1 VWA domain-containing protein [Solihabitans fulvus]